MLPDNELLRLVKQDDCEAFAGIYQKYWQALYDKAYKRTHDKEQCRDIIQNVFSDLWARRDTLEISNLPAFLHAAVRHQVLKLSVKAPANALFLDNLETILRSPLHTDDPILEKELGTLIRLWIAALPGKRRKIFLLHYTEDLPTEEISERLGISRKTVQNQLHTASQSLRLRLARFFALLFF